MRAKRWAEARRRSRLGNHAVDIRHWNRDWAWTMGASREAAAPAATRAAPLRMNRRRPSMSSLRLVDGADGEAGDEAIEEEIVNDRQRHAGDETCRHQRPPVIHVTPHERYRYTHADGHPFDRRDEGQAVDELLDGEGEGEDHDGQEPRHGQGEDDAPDGPEAAAPVDHGRVLDLFRQGLEEA